MLDNDTVCSFIAQKLDNLFDDSKSSTSDSLDMKSPISLVDDEEERREREAFYEDMDNDEYGFITSNKDQNAIITTLDHISQVLQDNAQSESFSYQEVAAMRLQLLDILYRQYYQDYVNAQAEEIRMHLSALFSPTRHRSQVLQRGRNHS